MNRYPSLLFFALLAACTSPGEAPVGAKNKVPIDAMKEAPARSDSVMAEIGEVLRLFDDTFFSELHVFTYEGWIENIDNYPGYKIDSASYKDNLRLKGGS